jgi:hypothetical protein
MKLLSRRNSEARRRAHAAQAEFIFACAAEWSVSKSKCFKEV